LHIGGLANVVSGVRCVVFDVPDGFGDLPDVIKDLLCFVGELPDVVEDLLCFVGELPDVVQDLLRFVGDLPDVVEDLLRFAEDITDIVGDLLSFAGEVRNLVPERLRIESGIAIGRRKEFWLLRQQSGSGCWRRKHGRGVVGFTAEQQLCPTSLVSSLLAGP